MFIVRVLTRKGEKEGTGFVRDEEFETRREVVGRVRQLGIPGAKFVEAGRTVRPVILETAAKKSGA